MNRRIVLVVIANVCLLALAAAAEVKPVDSTDVDTAVVKAAEVEVKAEVKQDTTEKAKAPAPEEKKVGTLEAYLVGEWALAPSKNVVSGDMIFRADGTYEKNEKQSDGSGAGIKGEYKLYTAESPCGIDLCLGKCGQPGSEWTTLFGIVRILGDGRVEILTSPDAKRPTAFPEKPDETYSMFLTRKPAAEK